MSLVIPSKRSIHLSFKTPQDDNIHLWTHQQLYECQTPGYLLTASVAPVIFSRNSSNRNIPLLRTKAWSWTHSPRPSNRTFCRQLFQQSRPEYEAVQTPENSSRPVGINVNLKAPVRTPLSRHAIKLWHLPEPFGSVSVVATINFQGRVMIRFDSILHGIV